MTIATSKRFKITITEIKTETKPGRDWVLLEKRPMTDEEMREEGDRSFRYLNTEERRAQIPMKEVHGYVDTTKTEEKEVKVYEQVLDNLEIGDVIKAANK